MISNEVDLNLESLDLMNDSIHEGGNGSIQEDGGRMKFKLSSGDQLTSDSSPEPFKSSALSPTSFKALEESIYERVATQMRQQKELSDTKLKEQEVKHKAQQDLLIEKGATLHGRNEELISIINEQAARFKNMVTGNSLRHLLETNASFLRAR